MGNQKRERCFKARVVIEVTFGVLETKSLRLRASTLWLPQDFPTTCSVPFCDMGLGHTFTWCSGQAGEQHQAQKGTCPSCPAWGGTLHRWEPQREELL